MRVALLLVALASACGGTNTTPSGGVRLECEPGTASVSVNEIYAGQARALAVRPIHLAPGKYRLEVVERGYFAHYEEVEVEKRIVTVRVTLRPRPE